MYSLRLYADLQDLPQSVLLRAKKTHWFNSVSCHQAHRSWPGSSIPFFHGDLFPLLVWFGAFHLPDAHGINLGSVVHSLFSSHITVIASNKTEKLEGALLGQGSDEQVQGEAAACRGVLPAGAHLHPPPHPCLTPRCPPACSPGSQQTPWSRSSGLCRRRPQ